jgi:hypothetical protein
MEMAEPCRYESTQEPLDEEERELMDPEHWDWNSAKLVPGGVDVAFEVSPLFSAEEYSVLAALAQRHGTDPTEAARRIILDRLAAEPLPRDVAGVGRGQSR